MNNLLFVSATPTDAPLITSLAEKIWREHYPSIITKEQIEFMLRNRYSENVIVESMKNGEQFYIAYSYQIPIAYASFQNNGEQYYLHKFYVDVSLHRHGTGSAFFEFLLQQMKPRLPIRLQVNRQNYKAVNFYFKMGFVIESVGDFDIGGGYFMNDFIMVKK
jgi:GNAT superfamily N-acetyltransferase